LSFFDEEDETRVRPPAAAPRRRGGGRPPGGGRTPPRGGRRAGADERAIQTRRAVGLAALIVLVILIVLGVHSCAVSSGNDALKSYNDSVYSLIRSSNQNGQKFFALLSGGTGSTNPTTLTSRVNLTRIAADNQLKRARGLNAPSELATAQRDLVLTMQLRRDGITNIAAELEPALQRSTAATAVNRIAVEMARLYASDVLYKDYSLPMIEGALTKAGIAVGGANGEPVDTVQFVPNIQWLTPSFVAQQLQTTAPSGSSKPPAPGVHGHALDSCSVGSSTLSTTAATTLPAGTAPTLTCTVTNDGQNTETDVHVKAVIEGTSITGIGTIPQTQPGQQYTVTVPLSAAPPNGTYSLSVTVEHVPGETTFTHNTKVFPVSFG